jgi:hypothetical protein
MPRPFTARLSTTVSAACRSGSCSRRWCSALTRCSTGRAHRRLRSMLRRHRRPPPKRRPSHPPRLPSLRPRCPLRQPPLRPPARNAVNTQARCCTPTKPVRVDRRPVAWTSPIRSTRAARASRSTVAKGRDSSGHVCTASIGGPTSSGPTPCRQTCPWPTRLLLRRTAWPISPHHPFPRVAWPWRPGLLMTRPGAASASRKRSPRWMPTPDTPCPQANRTGCVLSAGTPEISSSACAADTKFPHRGTLTGSPWATEHVKRLKTPWRTTPGRGAAGPAPPSRAAPAPLPLSRAVTSQNLSLLLCRCPCRGSCAGANGLPVLTCNAAVPGFSVGHPGAWGCHMCLYGR